MRIDGATDIGSVRKTNQDTCACGTFSENSVWGIVCDGMGGVNGGNIASALAIEAIETYITEEYEDGMGAGNIKAMLNNAVNKANDAVFNKAKNEPDLQGMGTTAVIFVITDRTMHVVHVGDSRAYLKNDDGLERLTMDHSYVQNLINFGQISEEEAKSHPKRNIITKVIGVYEEIQGDYIAVEFDNGDEAIACTDGLTNYFMDEELLELMDKYRGEELIKVLIEQAKERGGSDNITVVAVS